MSFFVPGAVPMYSTFAAVTNPASTAALLAELDSTNFKNGNSPRERIYQVHAWLSGSTNANWVVEAVTSTTVGAAAVIDRVLVDTAMNQTSQFVFKFRLTATTDRIRVRQPDALTGTFKATLMAEELA